MPDTSANLGTTDRAAPTINIDAARQFIELLTGTPDTAVTFQTFDDCKEKRSNLARVLHGSLDQHAASLEMLNQLGAGVFVTVNQTDGQGRKLENITGVRAVFVDCDSPEADPLRLIHDSALDPDFIVESSPGKYHAYRRVNGFPVDKEVFAGVQLLLADMVQGDFAVKDLTRVMRLPGFNHLKGAAVSVRLHEVRHPGRVTAFADLLRDLGISEDMARQRASAKGAPSTASGGQAATHVVPDDEFAMRMYEGDGRDNHCLRLAGWCAQRGMSEEVALAHVRGWNDNNYDPLPDHLVVSAVHRMIKREIAKRPEFALTELGFSERCAYRLSPRHRYVSDIGLWLYWDGRTWIWDNDAALLQEDCKGIARNLLTEAAACQDDYTRQALIKHNKTCETVRSIRAAMALMRSTPGIMVASCALDADPFKLACDNAVIDLKTGAASSPDPEALLTHRAHVEYEPGATCLRWLQFLGEVFEDNQDVIDYVQRLLGYCLTGSTREEVCAIFLGAGSNGKSTLINTVMALMGDYAQRLPASALMVKRGGSGSSGATPELARLRGARFAVTSEVAAGRQLDEELLKDLVSQDAIAARFLHRDFFQFQPSHKIVFALNHLPTIASGDHGTWRRLRVVPFNCTFDGANKDPTLVDKLKAESPGILNWLIAGCLEWQRGGLREPDAVKMRTKEYRTDLDIIGQFIADECLLAKDDPEHAAGYEVQAADLYQAYRVHCSTFGLPSVSMRLFGEDMKQRGFAKRRTNRGWKYLGIIVSPYQ